VTQRTQWSLQPSRLSGFTGRIFALLAAAVVTGGCIGHWVDEKCIKGKLSEEQAAAINDETWGHLPDYNQNEDGHCLHCAKVRDRILAEECSEFLKHPSRDL
jgi:hypothetical protein